MLQCHMRGSAASARRLGKALRREAAGALDPALMPGGR
jgi:hypothetical protein